MKIKLEDKTYEIEANGKFAKKYQETFNSNVLLDIFKADKQKDLLLMEQLTYCAIIGDNLPSFDEWIESFKTPFFILESFGDVLLYLQRDVTPTVQLENKKK